VREFAIAFAEVDGPGAEVHVEGFGADIFRAGGDVVKLEIGVGKDPDDGAVGEFGFEAGRGQTVAGEVDAEVGERVGSAGGGCRFFRVLPRSHVVSGDRFRG